jgi:hypothetical protein
MVRIYGWTGNGLRRYIMPLGAEKAALFGASGLSGEKNYWGDGSLGTCQFGASSITQTGESTDIDDVLSTGGESAGPSNNSYGKEQELTTGSSVNGVPYNTAVYEFTVANGTASITSDSGSTSGSSINADGDMVVANFSGLTIDADVCLTTQHPCRGLFVYVDGDCTINGALSMQSRGGWADPTSSGGGDSGTVPAAGIQLGLFTSGGSETFTNDASGFAGCGTAAVAAVANQDDISGDGTILTISRAGASGGGGGHGDSGNGSGGASGTTGGTTISSGGGGGGSTGGIPVGAGAAGTCFAGGGGGGANHSGSADYTPGPNGGKGGDSTTNQNGYYTTGGVGNPGGSTGGSGNQRENGSDGVGGLIWLLVKGDLTVGADGKIWAHGNNAADGFFDGGGSAGGCVMVAYAGTLTNNGDISATGSSKVGNWGSGGGSGGIHTIQVEE